MKRKICCFCKNLVDFISNTEDDVVICHKCNLHISSCNREDQNEIFEKTFDRLNQFIDYFNSRDVSNIIVVGNFKTFFLSLLREKIFAGTNLVNIIFRHRLKKDEIESLKIFGNDIGVDVLSLDEYDKLFLTTNQTILADIIWLPGSLPYHPAPSWLVVKLLNFLRIMGGEIIITQTHPQDNESILEENNVNLTLKTEGIKRFIQDLKFSGNYYFNEPISSLILTLEESSVKRYLDKVTGESIARHIFDKLKKQHIVSKKDFLEGADLILNELRPDIIPHVKEALTNIIKSEFGENVSQSGQSASAST